MDAVGPLVDRRDPRVAQVLRGTGLLDEAHAAMHLHAERGGLDAGIGAPRLRHGDQQRPARARGERGTERQHPPAECERAHGEQHAPHIGVRQDRPAALDAARREFRGAAEGALRDRDTLHRDAEPRRVHHREHRRQAAMLLAHQLAARAGELHHAGRARVDAELLLERKRAHRVARAVREEARHREEGDAAGAFRCAGQAGEHHVENVLRHLVLAVGDEDLLSADAEPVPVRLRARAQQAEVGARLRLGEAHRAGPAPADERREQAGLLVRRAVLLQQQDRVLGQQRAEAERHAGR